MLSDRDKINEFKQMFPEYADKDLSVKGDTICTAGGKTLGIRDNGSWRTVSVGGRPSTGLSYDVRVRITAEQNEKLSDYADDNGITKAAAVRRLIDGIET